MCVCVCERERKGVFTFCRWSRILVGVPMMTSGLSDKAALHNKETENKFRITARPSRGRRSVSCDMTADRIAKYQMLR